MTVQEKRYCDWLRRIIETTGKKNDPAKEYECT